MLRIERDGVLVPIPAEVEAAGQVEAYVAAVPGALFPVIPKEARKSAREYEAWLAGNGPAVAKAQAAVEEHCAKTAGRADEQAADAAHKAAVAHAARTSARAADAPPAAAPAASTPKEG